MLRPSLTRFLDEVLDRERRSLQIDEVAVPDGSPLAGSTLQDARIADHVGAMVVAIHTVDAIHGEEASPTADTATPVAGVTVRPGDSLVAVGTDAQLDRLREYVNGTAQPGTDRNGQPRLSNSRPLPPNTASRNSCGNRAAVGVGSSQSQCGKSLA